MIGSLTRSSLANKKQYRSLLAGNEPVSYGAYELISTQILSGTATSVTFSSVPNTYKHLQIRLSARTNRAATDDVLELQFNGDTGANYVRHVLFGSGSNILSQNETALNAARLGWVPGGDATASSFGGAVIDILDYQAAKNKTVRAFGGYTENSLPNRNVSLSSGLWLSTAAVTSVKINKQLGASFVANSRFSLYGIKG